MPGFVDLFAGCGGLSLGLYRAGFRHVLAVEKSPMAAETYFHNFIERLPTGLEGEERWREYLTAGLKEQAGRGLVVDEVARVLSNEGLMARLRAMELDLVAGGPPCQGFSMAGRRDPTDVRNQLAWQFLEFVEATKPKAVIIENVVGIGQDFVKHGAKAPLADLARALSATSPGYVVQPLRLNAMDFGVPQHRPRIFLVAVRSDVAPEGRAAKVLPSWSSSELPVSSLCPVPVRGVVRTVRDALWDLIDSPTGELVYSVDSSDPAYELPGAELASLLRCSPQWLPPAVGESPPPSEPLNRTQRGHAPAIRLRFEIYQYLDKAGLKPSLLNRAAKSVAARQEVEAEVRVALQGAPLPAVAPSGRVLAQELDELVFLVMRAATKKHSQRPLRWDEPSPTVMSLPDDFVHPLYPRTLTVREMARLQGFPDHFEFRSKETTGSERRRYEVPQYTQVGNAVAPFVAEKVGRAIRAIIDAETTNPAPALAPALR